jgi:DNA-binding response OmpR family regulator
MGIGFAAKFVTNPWFLFIITSSDKRLEELVASFEAGADHYMITPFTAEEFVVRIAATQRRMNHTQLLLSCLVLGDLMLDPVRQEVRIKDTMIELTANESRLLHYLVRHPNRAIRTEELLALLWGHGSKNDLSVVRTTMHRLRHKIEDNPGAPKYLKTVFRLGYRLCIQV